MENTDKQIQEQAEKYAMQYHYPDSVAKGLRDKDGEYFTEAEQTIEIYTAGAQWMQEREKSEAHSLKMALIEILHCAQTLEQAKEMASQELNETSSPKD